MHGVLFLDHALLPVDLHSPGPVNLSLTAENDMKFRQAGINGLHHGIILSLRLRELCTFDLPGCLDNHLPHGTPFLTFSTARRAHVFDCRVPSLPFLTPCVCVCLLAHHPLSIKCICLM